VQLVVSVKEYNQYPVYMWLLSHYRLTIATI
jgi:hypothetical protein